MSTRRERAERKNLLAGLAITGCSYGAHAFVRTSLPAHWANGPQNHMHVCSECGAAYLEMDPCWCGGAA